MRRSYLWAGLFTAAIVGWFASGELVPGDTARSPVEPAREQRADVPFRVQVARFTAQPNRSTGLAESVTVIVVGQDFVTDGQFVEPVFATVETR
jgi:hypothetical protein